MTFNNPRHDSVRTGSDHSQSNMNMSDKSIALVLTLFLFVFLAQCKCLISSYSLSLNWFLICIYTLHPHEHIIYQVVLSRIFMLELQGGKLLLASPYMEIVIKGGTKMEKWSTAAIQTTFFSAMTRFSSVGPIAHPANDA